MAKILSREYTLDLVAPRLDDMTDDEFYSFCEQNKHIHIERDENHQIIFMPPVGNESSSWNAEISADVIYWNRKNKLGKAFDSSAGFYLPDTSMKSPDAAWMRLEKWESLTKEEQSKFAHITPDFVVELMSPSDNQKQAKLKMEKWMQNGVLLGWLIDPQMQEAFIYRADGTVSKLQGFQNKLSGEDVLPDFELDLSILV